jgi:hypothetical protein
MGRLHTPHHFQIAVSPAVTQPGCVGAEAGGFLVKRRAAAARCRKAGKQSGAATTPGDDNDKAADEGADQGQSTPLEAAGDTAAPASPQSPAGGASGSEQGASSAVKEGRDKDPLEQLLEEEVSRGLKVF